MRVALLGQDTPSTPAIVEAARALGAELVPAGGPRDAADAACVVVDLDAPGVDRDIVTALAHAGLAPMAIRSRMDLEEVDALVAAGARDVVAAPLHKRDFILRLGAVAQAKVRIACIGGGTGLYSVLSALKDVPRVHLGSIVTMSDDGGSSGKLRTSFGILPPGDVRRSLVALSNAPEVMNHVMQYRFSAGEGLRGHSLGNLLLAALADFTGGMQGAVKALGDILNVQGTVMCITDDATTLCAEFEDGRVVRGESAIDQCLERPSHLRVRRVWHEPEARTSVDVRASLLVADLIVLGPGDLYTSVLSGLIVGGVADAVRESRAKRLYVCNLMTKPGETAGYDVADHVTAIVDTLGKDALDYVLVSNTDVDPQAVVEYATKGQHPVAPSPPARLRARTSAEILSRDVGHRSRLVRHDAEKLRDEIVALIPPRPWSS